MWCCPLPQWSPLPRGSLWIRVSLSPPSLPPSLSSSLLPSLPLFIQPVSAPHAVYSTDCMGPPQLQQQVSKHADSAEKPRVIWHD